MATRPRSKAPAPGKKTRGPMFYRRLEGPGGQRFEPVARHEVSGAAGNEQLFKKLELLPGDGAGWFSPVSPRRVRWSLRAHRARALARAGALAAAVIAIPASLASRTGGELRLKAEESASSRIAPASAEFSGHVQPGPGSRRFSRGGNRYSYNVDLREPVSPMEIDRSNPRMRELLEGAGAPLAVQPLDPGLRERLATMLAVEVGFAEPTPEVYSRVLNSVKVRAQERFEREGARRKAAGMPPLTDEETLSIYHKVLDPDEYQGLRPENIRLVREEDPQTRPLWGQKVDEARKFVDENWHRPVDPQKDGRFFYTSEVETDEKGNPMFDEKGKPVLRRPKIPAGWDAEHVSTTPWTDKSAKAHKAIIVAKPRTPTPSEKAVRR